MNTKTRTQHPKPNERLERLQNHEIFKIAGQRPLKPDEVTTYLDIKAQIRDCLAPRPKPAASTPVKRTGTFDF